MINSERKIFFISGLFLFTALSFTACKNQNENSVSVNSAKGNLFIIGGGERTDSLMLRLIQIANLSTNDYIVVLPMSSSEPDSAFIYVNDDFKRLIGKEAVMMNFDSTTANDKVKCDSLLHAKLIFISGGDQNRFMKIVNHTLVQQSIQKAYANGSTISGTSAGAAVMSAVMLTGNQRADTSYSVTVDLIAPNNVITDDGLGLLKNTVIDQHFITRSRYNRLFSVLIDHPELDGIGIDESTALWVHGDSASVVGASQVMVFHLQSTTAHELLHPDVSIYDAGASFRIKE